MRFLFIMDPIERVQIHLDSTFSMMLESQGRGHEVWFALSTDLRLVNGEPMANARPCTLRPVQGDHVDVGDAEDHSLRTYDAIFMRKDPPFDMEYIYLTYMLDLV